MNLNNFRTLCIQRIQGEKTELECLREVREVLTPSDPENIQEIFEKRVFEFLYHRLVDALEEHQCTESDLLSQQIEEWMSCPTLKSKMPIKELILDSY